MTLASRPTRALVIFDGNCQGHHLAAILSNMDGIETYSLGGDLGFLPSFGGRPTRYITEADALARVQDAKARGRRTYQVSQSTQLARIRASAYTALVDKVISHPFLQFYTLSPAAFAQTFGAAAPPKRIFDIDVGTIRVSQEKAESRADFAGFVAERSKTHSLFQTTTHLGGELTAMLFREVAREIAEAAPEAVERLGDELAASEGMNFHTDHPVAPPVLEALNFTWSPTYALYAGVLAEAKAGAWDALYRRRQDIFAAFPDDTQAAHAVAMAAYHKGDESLAEASFERLLRLSPGCLQFWFGWLDLYWRKNSPAGLDAVIDKASRFFGGQRLFSYLMTFTELRRGGYALAEDYAKDYSRRTPDRADGIIPWLKVLGTTGREAAGRDAVTNYARHASPRELSDLRQNMPLVPELGFTPESLAALGTAAP